MKKNEISIKLSNAIKMENEDEQIEKIAEVIEKIPPFHRHTIRELFKMFHDLLKKSEKNNVDVDFLAQNFSSILTKSLTGAEHIFLFKLLCNNYSVILKPLNPLQENDIQYDFPRHVFLSNGKSVEISVSPMDTLQKVREIVKGQIEKSDECAFYLLSDYSIKLLEDNQGIRGPLWFVPRIDTDTLEESSGSEESSLGEVVDGRTTLTTSQPMKARSLSQVNLNTRKIDPKETEEKKELLSNIPPQGPYLIWVFPDESRPRARDWDPYKSLEAELFCVRERETNCNIKIDGVQKYSVNAMNLYQVLDSSRYFLLVDDKTKIGIGFYSREESSLFRVALSDLLLGRVPEPVKPTQPQTN